MRAECYMCDAAAVTKEHVPPRCFFPERLWANLVTVPSCAQHNLENSKDVEYVRNVISTQHGTNDAAAGLFETTKRSFDRSPKLMSRTFRDVRPIMVGGEKTGAFRVDLARHRSVMSAIAYALYFQNHGQKHRGGWRIFTPSFGYAGSVYGGQSDPWENLRHLLASGQYTPMPVPHPEVFNYGVLQMEHNQIMYRFVFYTRVVVNAWTHFQTFVHWSRN